MRDLDRMADYGPAALLLLLVTACLWVEMLRP
jgi:hypothetical protein